MHFSRRIIEDRSKNSVNAWKTLWMSFFQSFTLRLQYSEIKFKNIKFWCFTSSLVFVCSAVETIRKIRNNSINYFFLSAMNWVLVSDCKMDEVWDVEANRLEQDSQFLRCVFLCLAVDDFYKICRNIYIAQKSCMTILRFTNYQMLFFQYLVEKSTELFFCRLNAWRLLDVFSPGKLYNIYFIVQK